MNNCCGWAAILKEREGMRAAFDRFDPQKIALHSREKIADTPVKTTLSGRISKDLKNRGFKFMGSATVCAFMQSAGLANDPMRCCARHPARTKGH